MSMPRGNGKSVDHFVRINSIKKIKKSMAELSPIYGLTDNQTRMAELSPIYGLTDNQTRMAELSPKRGGTVPKAWRNCPQASALKY